MINNYGNMETITAEEYHGAFTTVHPLITPSDVQTGYSHFSLTSSISTPPKITNYKLNNKMNDYLNNNSPISSATEILDNFNGKNSENSRRFSVNNLLQLATCTSRNITGK